MLGVLNVIEGRGMGPGMGREVADQGADVGIRMLLGTRVLSRRRGYLRTILGTPPGGRRSNPWGWGTLWGQCLGTP